MEFVADYPCHCTKCSRNGTVACGGMDSKWPDNSTCPYPDCDGVGTMKMGTAPIEPTRVPLPYKSTPEIREYEEAVRRGDNERP